MTRGFQIVSSYRNQGIELPRRATNGSAGYDLRSAEDIVVPSYINYSTLHETINDLRKMYPPKKAKQSIYLWLKNNPQLRSLVTLVHTGIKAYFPQNEYLKIFNRSSNPVKRGLVLANSVGVIDSDYYNNPSNEGELCAAFINFGTHNYHIHKGDRIVQGIFGKYLLADNDNPVTNQRLGGFGSTGKK